VGLHKLARLPLERLQELEHETMQHFSARRLEHRSQLRRDPTADELKFQEFLKSLETVVLRTRKRLLNELGSIEPSSVKENLAATTIDYERQMMVAMAIGSICFCSDEDESIIDDFQNRGLLCEEFLFRYRRLANSVKSPSQQRIKRDDIYEEHSSLVVLCSEIMSRATPTVLSLGLSLEVTTVIRSLELFFRGYVDELTSTDHQGHLTGYEGCNFRARDCLGRNAAHQWLDAMRPTLDNEEWLDAFKEHVTLQDGGIDDQDFLGRTLLHIACQHRWHAGAFWLLQHGANVSALTAYGSLPIHYAAAAGSRNVVKLLLPYETNFHRLQKDSAGVSALRYAITLQQESVGKLLGHIPQVKLTAGALDRPELDAGLSSLLVEEPAVSKRFSDLDPEGPQVSSTHYYCSPQIAAHALRAVLRYILSVDGAWVQDRPAVTGVIRKVDSYLDAQNHPKALATSQSAVVFKNALSILLQLSYELHFTSGIVSTVEGRQTVATLALSLTMCYIEPHLSGVAFLPHENRAVGMIYGEREGPLDSFVKTSLGSSSYNVF
jgi:hypothetical protein